MNSRGAIFVALDVSTDRHAAPVQTAIDITVQSCTTLADTPFMFWWFKRGNEFVRYESRQVKPGAFELRFVDTDGSERVETFNNERVLEERQREVEKSLTGDGWTGPHGWNL